MRLSTGDKLTSDFVFLRGLDGWRHLHLPSVGSTNDVAMQFAREGEIAPIWITADEQTAGRGRHGRSWVSEQGNLYSSLLLIFERPKAEHVSLPLAIAVALHGAILRAAPVLGDRLKVKWPNDLLLDGAKISGILLEATQLSDGRQAIVVGIGVNLHTAPDTALYSTTTLSMKGINITSHDFFPQLATSMAHWLDVWNEGQGVQQICDSWRAICVGLGEKITARFHDGEVYGTFEDINGIGELLLRTEDDGLKSISAADIFFASSRQFGA